MYRAASTSNSSFFEKLIDPSSTLLQVTTEKNTVLHIALQCEQFHVVEELVRLLLGSKCLEQLANREHKLV